VSVTAPDMMMMMMMMTGRRMCGRTLLLDRNFVSGLCTSKSKRR